MSCSGSSLRKGQTAEFLARIVGWENTPVLQADVDSISYSAFILEQATGVENEVEGFQDVDLTPVSDYLSDTLLIGTKWTEDSTGYNFHFIPSADIFEERGETYLLRVTFVLADPDAENLVAIYTVDLQ